jgi:uncharacterized protein affecting Mg2+/Co2+ transport
MHPHSHAFLPHTHSPPSPHPDPTPLCLALPQAFAGFRALQQQQYLAACSSTATTHGLTVEATSCYSGPSDGFSGRKEHVFTYRVRVTSTRSDKVQVGSRGGDAARGAEDGDGKRDHRNRCSSGGVNHMEGLGSTEHGSASLPSSATTKACPSISVPCAASDLRGPPICHPATLATATALQSATLPPSPPLQRCNTLACCFVQPAVLLDLLCPRHPAQLLGREWDFKDSHGELTARVRPQADDAANGLVGQTPYLPPGHCFEYYSGAALPTTTGTAEGHLLVSARSTCGAALLCWCVPVLCWCVPVLCWCVPVLWLVMCSPLKSRPGCWMP